MALLRKGIGKNQSKSAMAAAQIMTFGLIEGQRNRIFLTHSTNVETACLLSKLNVDHHIEVELNLDEMDLTAAEKKATY